MRDNKIIGFTGTMGVGKSTAIEILREYARDYKSVTLVKFASPIYDMQEYIYNRIKSTYVRGEDFKKDRMLLQWLGTEWGRGTIRSTLWVDLWKADVAEALSADNLVVCDDVRFDNEAQTVRQLGGVVVKICSLSNRGAPEGIVNHASESGISPENIDITIYNDGTKEQFRIALEQIFKNVGVSK